MPNPNAIVALLIRIDPPVEKLSGGEYFRRYPDGAAIAFEANLTAKLLGTVVKAAEVQFHHEVYNQFLWNLF